MGFVIEEFVTQEQVELVFSEAFQGLTGKELSYWKRILSSYMKRSVYDIIDSPNYTVNDIVSRVVAEALNHDSQEGLIRWGRNLETWLVRYDEYCKEAQKEKEENNVLTPVFFMCKYAGDPDWNPNVLARKDGTLVIGDDYKDRSDKDVFTYFSFPFFLGEDLNRHTAVFLLAYAKQATKEKNLFLKHYPERFTPFVEKGLLKPEKVEEKWVLIAKEGFSGKRIITEMYKSAFDMPTTNDLEKYIRYWRNGKLEYLTEDSIRRYRSEAKKAK